MIKNLIIYLFLIITLFSVINSEEINKKYVFNKKVDNIDEFKELAFEKVINQIQQYANKYNLNENQFISVLNYACSYKPEKCSIYNGELPETLLTFAKTVLKTKSDQVSKLIQDAINKEKDNYFKLSPDINQNIERLLISLNILGGATNTPISNNAANSNNGGTGSIDSNSKIPSNNNNIEQLQQQLEQLQQMQSNQQTQPQTQPQSLSSNQQQQSQQTQQQPLNDKNFNNGFQLSQPLTEQQEREIELAAQRQMEREYRERQQRREMAEKARAAALSMQQHLGNQVVGELTPILTESQTIDPTVTPLPKTLPPYQQIPKTNTPPPTPSPTQTQKPTSPPPQTQPPPPPKSSVTPSNLQSSNDDALTFGNYFDSFLDIVDLFTKKYDSYQKQQQQIEKSKNIDTESINKLSQVSPAIKN